jgi:hypothetical protein
VVHVVRRHDTHGGDLGRDAVDHDLGIRIRRVTTADSGQLEHAGSRDATQRVGVVVRADPLDQLLVQRAIHPPHIAAVPALDLVADGCLDLGSRRLGW